MDLENSAKEQKTEPSRKFYLAVLWTSMCLMILLFVVLMCEMAINMPYGWKNQSPKIEVHNNIEKDIYYWTGFNLDGVITCGVLLSIVWVFLFIYSIWVYARRSDLKDYLQLGIFSLFEVILAIFFIVTPCLFNTALYEHWNNDWTSSNGDVLNGAYSSNAYSLYGTVTTGVVGIVPLLVCLVIGSIMLYPQEEHQTMPSYNIVQATNQKQPEKTNLVINNQQNEPWNNINKIRRVYANQSEQKPTNQVFVDEMFVDKIVVTNKNNPQTPIYTPENLANYVFVSRP